MARRIIKFKNFRNLGLEGNENNIIILNNCLEKGKMGNIVELIGANNSGKSNVLDGILALAKGNIEQRDITTLSFKEEDRKPEISLCIQDDGELVRNLSLEGVSYYNSLICNSKPRIDKDEVVNTFNKVISIYNTYGIGHNLYKEIQRIQNDSINESEMISIIVKLRNQLDTNSKKFTEWRNVKNQLQTSLLYSSELLNDIETMCKDKFGFSLTPNIIKYNEKMITSNDMQTQINNLNSNLFFRSVFKAIEIDPEEIINGFKQYNEFRNSASLNKLRKMVNEKTSKLNDRFNKLYFAENDQYKFTIDIESSKISFGMARGEDDDPIMIEMQSTGFRWFFNLYFNFICSNELKPGDIIIMDEPATNLHPEGQRELRRFIKDFAIENDLTFLIATHSPFLIDTDNYDELRIVTMENNRSSIDNLFTAVNNDDPDTIVPIKEALTIKQNILYDMDTEVVWVEGLTDYCYLTAFKNMLNIKNVAFLPFNGVGADEDAQKIILNKIVSTKFFKRSILLDGDKAGKSMAKKCENTVFENRVYVISDLGIEFKEIEDLFSSNDKIKWKIEKNSEVHKKASDAIYLKSIATISDFDDETVNNFKKLFDMMK